MLLIFRSLKSKEGNIQLQTTDYWIWIGHLDCRNHNDHPFLVESLQFSLDRNTRLDLAYRKTTQTTQNDPERPTVGGLDRLYDLESLKALIIMKHLAVIRSLTSCLHFSRNLKKRSYDKTQRNHGLKGLEGNKAFIFLIRKALIGGNKNIKIFFTKIKEPGILNFY